MYDDRYNKPQLDEQTLQLGAEEAMRSARFFQSNSIRKAILLVHTVDLFKEYYQAKLTAQDGKKTGYVLSW